ncbi:MAG: DUF5701 family protein [Ancrocorticia sp.]|uniref:DUF5701 family protein n=1 Tax=Ancrocorticia sp. TaxID=2593684 RepID=UPI003F931DAC
MRVVKSVEQQITRLEQRGVLERAQGDSRVVREAANRLTESSGSGDGALVGLHPGWFLSSDLAPLMVRAGKAGFIVEDMIDVDEFVPVEIDLPDTPLYLVHDVQRGDEYQNESPEEVQIQLTAARRRPLTLQEGLSWAISHPEIVEANNCFMTIGSRKAKRKNLAGEATYDARTPAIWNASGTGRDGKERKGAPKLGWCWWRNRHTWLGIASAAV